MEKLTSLRQRVALTRHIQSLAGSSLPSNKMLLLDLTGQSVGRLLVFFQQNNSEFIVSIFRPGEILFRQIKVVVTKNIWKKDSLTFKTSGVRERFFFRDPTSPTRPFTKVKLTYNY